jgi:hypothetical protein
MRHSASVKAILFFPLFFATCALADEAADRLAIVRTIAALNQVPQPSRSFGHRATPPPRRQSSAPPLLFRMNLGAKRPSLTLACRPFPRWS